MRNVPNYIVFAAVILFLLTSFSNIKKHSIPRYVIHFPEYTYRLSPRAKRDMKVLKEVFDDRERNGRVYFKLRGVLAQEEMAKDTFLSIKRCMVVVNYMCDSLGLQLDDFVIEPEQHFEDWENDDFETGVQVNGQMY